jgi:hypothetical protein
MIPMHYAEHPRAMSKAVQDPIDERPPHCQAKDWFTP